MVEGNYKFDYKPYSRKLRKPLRASYGELWTREGFIVRLEDAQGNVGFGDAAPLEHFSTETLEEARDILDSLYHNPFEPRIKNFPCVQSALESARWMSKQGRQALVGQRNVTMLLPAGSKSLHVIEKYLAQDYSSFKWKIAVESDELNIFKQLLKLAPNAIFRLDANGSLNKADLGKWLDFQQIEFVEQPLPPGEEKHMITFDAGQRIALDESAQRTEDMEKLSVMGWQGFIVVKPSFIGNVDSFLRFRNSSNMRLIYSSGFESTIGMTFGLALAASDKNNFSLGYGVQDYFTQDKFGSIPIKNASINFEKVRNIDFQSIWNSLDPS